MILIVDNYDSFVHNIARYVRETGARVRVMRNDAASAEAMLSLGADGVIISPGPKSPAAAGVSKAVIAGAPPTMPVLGVCLGHQCLAEVHGGATRRAGAPMHGRRSQIDHDGAGVFHGLPAPLQVGRYHSLTVDLERARNLIVSARSDDGEIMGVRHETLPREGVQFHPESILTEFGRRMIENFVDACDAARRL